MIGSTVSPKAIGDMQSLLELIRDPKAYKAAVDRLADLVKQGQDRLAEAEAKERDLASAQASAAGIRETADAQMQEAAAATEKAAEALRELDTRTLSLDTRQVELTKAAELISDERKRLSTAVATHNRVVQQQADTHKAAMASAREASERAQEALQAGEALRTEYEERLAKIKALAGA